MSLPLHDTVQKLKKYTNSSFPILSVYLKIPQQQNFKQISMVQRFQELVYNTYDETKQTLYKNDIQLIGSFLQNYRKLYNKKSLLIFSGGNKLFEMVTTSFYLPEQVIINYSPFLTPLQTALNDYKRYLVVLADREKAKYFTLYLGEIESHGSMFNDTVPQKVKGRNRTNRVPNIDQHIREHLNQHLKYIGNHVNDFVKNKSITGVLIGGHKTLLHRVEEHLPKHLKDKVIGEFISDLHASINDLVSQSKSILARATASQQFNQQKQFDLSRI